MTRPPLSSPSCQSCGIIIKNASEFGKTATGVIAVDYCRFCYKDGQFTEPDITMEEMIEKVAKTMSEQRRVPLEKAKEAVKESLPKLKRWAKKAGGEKS
ncbi:MAG: zinc ribbon domain-containing protein [Thermodesulfobacteriota bacterium]